MKFARRLFAAAAAAALVLPRTTTSASTTATLLATAKGRSGAFRRETERSPKEEWSCHLEERTEGGGSQTCSHLSQDLSAASASSSSSVPFARAQEWIQQAVLKTERGIHYTNHLRQLRQLMQASSSSSTSSHEDKKNEEQEEEEGQDSLTAKWRLIHDKAVQSLEEAFQLWIKAKRTTPAVVEEARQGLVRTRHVLVELHSDPLYPPPSPDDENGDLYLLNSRRASHKEETLMHRARQAYAKGRRYWKHMSQAMDEPPVTARWAARWEFLHTEATKALGEALTLFSRAGVLSNDLEDVRQLMLQVQSAVVLMNLPSSPVALVDLVPAATMETKTKGGKAREIVIRM